MKEFERKRTAKKILYSKFTIFILAVILGLLLKGMFSIYLKVRESENNLDFVQAKFSELEDRQQNLNEKILNIQSDIGREEQIRNKFSLAKEGEKAIFIVGEEEQAPKEQEKSFLGSFWFKATSWFSG